MQTVSSRVRPLPRESAHDRHGPVRAFSSTVAIDETGPYRNRLDQTTGGGTGKRSKYAASESPGRANALPSVQDGDEIVGAGSSRHQTVKKFSKQASTALLRLNRPPPIAEEDGWHAHVNMARQWSQHRMAAHVASPHVYTQDELQTIAIGEALLSAAENVGATKELRHSWTVETAQIRSESGGVIATNRPLTCLLCSRLLGGLRIQSPRVSGLRSGPRSSLAWPSGSRALRCVGRHRWRSCST